MKKTIVLLCGLLLLFAASALAEADEVSGDKIEDLLLLGIPLEAEACDHCWSRDIVYATTDTIRVEIRRTQYVDVGDYHVINSYVMHTCVVCKVKQEMPEEQKEQHLYVVQGYEAERQDPDIIHITYSCELCEHIRIETVSLDKLQDPDMNLAAVGCRYGGTCPMVGGKYMPNARGKLVEYDGHTWYLARVLVNENGQEVWKVARRLDCWTCRRPYMQIRDEIDDTWEGYNSLPQFTCEEFMADLRNDLPYQLIDMLRQAKAAK